VNNWTGCDQLFTLFTLDSLGAVIDEAREKSDTGADNLGVDSWGYTKGFFEVAAGATASSKPNNGCCVLRQSIFDVFFSI
jgi:hypothetical protein